MTYSDRMRERYLVTGEGAPIDLGPKMGVFWSRGWKGCPWCEKSVHTRVRLYPFREGERSGWRCRP